MKPGLNKQEVVRCLKLRDEGVKNEELAKIFNVSVETVSKFTRDTVAAAARRKAEREGKVLQQKEDTAKKADLLAEALIKASVTSTQEGGKAVK
jgi:predicted transcriptional regulator